MQMTIYVDADRADVDDRFEGLDPPLNRARFDLTVSPSSTMSRTRQRTMHPTTPCHPSMGSRDEGHFPFITCDRSHDLTISPNPTNIRDDAHRASQHLVPPRHTQKARTLCGSHG
jgi:hypothetical protein